MENADIRRFAQVHLLDVPYHLDRPFTYYITEELADTVQKGRFVLVPFGGGNRKTIGLVTAIVGYEEIEETVLRRCKPVLEVLSEEFVLDETLLGLCAYLRDMTFCTMGDAAKAVIPTGGLRKLRERYTIDPEKEREFCEQYPEGCPERELYLAVAGRCGMRGDAIRQKLGEEFLSLAKTLAKKGFFKKEAELSAGENETYTEFVRLNIPGEDAEQLLAGNPLIRKQYQYRRRGTAYEQLLSTLLEKNGEECERSALLQDGVITSKAIADLEKAGIVTVRREERYRNPYACAAEEARKNPPKKTQLNPEQEAARAQLSALYQTGEAHAALLFGVTGSGKTHVIKAMMDEVIADGKQVIMLVPEIALTPQSVGIFCAYYGERVAVVHSGLSTGERLDVWRRAKRGDVDLVIGTRSAVFTPFERLGMIVIDEEQEHTYKSDSTPKYHARDAARYRCAKSGALLLLASATPSFESYHKAKKGIYTLIKMENRYGGATLPQVIMADLHDDGCVTGETPLGSVLS